MNSSIDEFTFRVLTLQSLVFVIFLAQTVYLYLQIKLFLYFQNTFFQDKDNRLPPFFISSICVSLFNMVFFAIWKWVV